VKFACENSKGVSEQSEILYVSTTALPAQASTPEADYSLSSANSLYVKWALTADQTGPGGLITGYVLYMDDGLGGLYSPIFNTVNVSPTIQGYLVSGLTTGRQYRFKLEAYNFNGAGPESAVATLQACAMPSGLAIPSRVSSTSTAITIRWNEPTN